MAGRSKGPAAPAFACALGALMLYAIIATGRAGTGIETSGASRYTYLVIALAVPAIGLALADLVDAGGLASAGRRAVVCLLLLFVGVHNAGLLVDKSRVEKRLEQRLKARILAAAQLVNSPAVILGGNPEPQYSPDIVVDDLRRMHRDGKLPEPERITRDDRITVATTLQYAVNPVPLSTPYAPALVDGVVGADGDYDTTAGCIRLFPTGPIVELHLVGGDPMSLRVTTLALRRAGRLPPPVHAHRPDRRRPRRQGAGRRPRLRERHRDGGPGRPARPILSHDGGLRDPVTAPARCAPPAPGSARPAAPGRSRNRRLTRHAGWPLPRARRRRRR